MTEVQNSGRKKSWVGERKGEQERDRGEERKMGDGRWEMGGFVLRTTSVSPLDRDKDTLSLTREKCWRIFPYESE